MQSVFPKNILQEIVKSLSINYSHNESESLAYIILEAVFNWTKTDLFINEKKEIETGLEIIDIVERLILNEPIQHILGNAEFYGHKYLVNEHVLIPRQETEELIELIKLENPKRGLRVLDIGTGSGCIACSLSKEMNQAEIFALDVSQQAMEVAQENAKNIGCDVSFNRSDILNDPIGINDLDIIISNPPYVTENEKEQMHKNVLEHEPELALFVSNEKPLIFYDVISQKAKLALKRGGRLYFEINELFGKEVALLMEQNGFDEVRIHDDLNGKNRFVCGKLNEE